MVLGKSILVVEDEQDLREIIVLFLQAEGFDVREAADGRAALGLFDQSPADLVILDAMLPDISGFDVCRHIRSVSDVPIIFLTALEDDNHQMLGYRLGADDYVTKPFKVSILAMKAARMLSRTAGTAQPSRRIMMDRDARICRVDTEEVSLTQKEFDLLAHFLDNPGRVLTREYLLEVIWGFDFAGESRAVDSMVKNLRKKLGSAAALIKTVISVGYKYEEHP